MPSAEKARMEMRDVRCRAEASAEDLSRTLVLDGEKLRQIITSKKRANGGLK